MNQFWFIIAIPKKKKKNNQVLWLFYENHWFFKVFEMNIINNSLIVKCFQKLETHNYLTNSLKQTFHFIQSLSQFFVIHQIFILMTNYTLKTTIKL